MSLGRTLKLNNGLRIPQMAYGTWLSKPGEVANGVEVAIKTGYRHIDCAPIYENQNEVAEGIKNGGVPREQLTIVSKLWNTNHRPERCEGDLDRTLKQLQLDYLDVWLIHWPAAFAPGDVLQPLDKDGNRAMDYDAPSLVETWKEVVRIYKETKKVKAVGVSNCSVEVLEMLINATGVVPEINQIEAHPQLQQPELFKYCKDKGIIITAYSPLGNNTTGKARVLDSPEVQKIAKELNEATANVLLEWCAHQGFAVISKSVTPSRIKSNFQDMEMSDADFEIISKWGKNNYSRNNIPALYPKPWDINIFGEPEEQKATRKVW